MAKLYHFFTFTALLAVASGELPVIRRAREVAGSLTERLISVEASGRLTTSGDSNVKTAEPVEELPSPKYIEVIFVKNVKNPMSDLVRGDEASVILTSPWYKASGADDLNVDTPARGARADEVASMLDSPWYQSTSGGQLPNIMARSITCASFQQEECDPARNLGAHARVVVHIKWLCMCPHKKLSNSLHVLDPVDESIKYGGLVSKESYLRATPCVSDGVRADCLHAFCSHGQTTSCVSGLFVNSEASRVHTRKKLNSSDVLVAVIPHHHSNFHDRRHKVKLHATELTLGVAGGLEADASRALFKFARRHALKLLNTPNNDVKFDGQAPSKRGDFYASWNERNVDIGVVWQSGDSYTKQHPAEAFEEKPSQRLINMLATGVPTVADGRFQSFRDVQRLGATLPGAPKVLLADSIVDAMTKIEELRLNSTLREEVAQAGLQVAKEFSPASVARRYAAFMRDIVESSRQRGVTEHKPKI